MFARTTGAGVAGKAGLGGASGVDGVALDTGTVLGEGPHPVKNAVRINTKAHCRVKKHPWFVRLGRKNVASLSEGHEASQPI